MNASSSSSSSVRALVRALTFRGDGPVDAFIVSHRAAEALAGGENVENVALALTEAMETLAAFGGEIPSNEFPEQSREETLGWYNREGEGEWDPDEEWESDED